MPNWNMNRLTIEHEDPAKLQEFVDAYNSGETCEHYIPHPPEILKGMEDPKNNDWYDWRVSNWGTKWDFGLEEHGKPATVENNQVTISFNTAWSPPIGLYEELDRLEFKVDATYFEPGMGFCGRWYDGNDEYYEGGLDNFPEDLIEEYNIEEFH